LYGDEGAVINPIAFDYRSQLTVAGAPHQGSYAGVSGDCNQSQKTYPIFWLVKVFFSFGVQHCGTLLGFA
jgi:hypothetical protein